jgi:protein SCO1/2
MNAVIRTLAALCLGFMLLAAARSAAAQPGHSGPPEMREKPVELGAPPKELDGIGITDKNGAKLPRDIKLTGSDGRALVLGEMMDGERPLVLVLAYYGCPMLCSMVLNATITGLKGAPEQLGRDYRVLVVSFDPRDGVDVAREKRESYLESFGKLVSPVDGSERNAFEFAVADEADVRRLAETVGFNYRWDEEQKQYAHAAGMFIVTPKGELSQTLTGIDYASQDISNALKDAKAGIWQSPLKSVLMFCFQYNPHTGKYVLLAGRAMRVGAAITILVMAFVMYRLFRADRNKRSALKLSQRAT